MNDEAKQIIAFVFNRSGKKHLQESDVYLTISMELKWCSPKIAKDFVSNACVVGLLGKDGEEVTPLFDPHAILIPLGFRPTEEMFVLGNNQQHIEVYEQKKAIDMLIERVLKKTSLDKGLIRDEIQALSEKKHLYEYSAAAILARSYEVNIVDIIPKLKEEAFFKGNIR
jgi:hypothetical protein